MDRQSIVSAKFLTRGDIIVSSDKPRFVTESIVVLAASVHPPGGAGMGEYPESWKIVLSDGRLLIGDGWSKTPAGVPETFTIAGKAKFTLGGKLVKGSF